MATATLSSLLPAPVTRPRSPSPKPEQQQRRTATTTTTEVALVGRTSIPPYGKRQNFIPRREEDFGDGGAYPEKKVAQYPLGMGRKATNGAGKTLALTVDADGKVAYDAIARQGHRSDRHVQSQFKDLVPLSHRTDLTPEQQAMERPSDDSIAATTSRTAAALEKLTSSKIKAAQPKNVPQTGGSVQYMRYTPSSGEGGQRIIKMMEVVEDPLEPPKFKAKKIPRGPPSPPAPILRSPPRKVTAQDQRDWMIPPCISNWKNNKGYTIPLDKRLAADGRGLQEIQINDRFASFSESLYIADRHAREEVRERTLLQQRIAQKEKDEQEEALRLRAQQSRDERAGIVSSSAAAGGGAVGMTARLAGAEAVPTGPGLGGYGSDSDEEEEEGVRGADDDGEDEKAARERDAMRAERRKEREREMRMSNMGTEQRARQLARATGRDISEKVALGLAKPTLSAEAMVDSRLYNQESYSSSFADDDSYNLYDKPLFQGSSAAAAIYKRGGQAAEDYEQSDEGVQKAMQNDRFGLGMATRGKGFQGADLQVERDGPVQFERDTTGTTAAASAATATTTTADPFGVDAFLNEATKKGAKRGLDTSMTAEGSRKKRARGDDDE